MANKPTDLANYNPADSNNPDGTLKDQVYSGGSISEIGSRAYARFLTDCLSVWYRLVREWGGTLNGSTDSQASSQFYDALDSKIKNESSALSKQYSRSAALPKNMHEIDLSVGPLWNNGDRFVNGANISGLNVFTYKDISPVAQLYSIVYNSNTLEYIGVANVSSVLYLPSGIVSQLPKTRVDNVRNRFAVSHYNPNATGTPLVYRSGDGLTWTSHIVDSDAANRDGGHCIEAFDNGRLCIAAYDDADNSTYHSDDGGLTWTRRSHVATTPNHKPIVSASSGTEMLWVDQDTGVAKTGDGETFTGCTFSGGTLAEPIDAVWAGNVFVILTSDYLWVSSPSNTGSFTRRNLPVSSVSFEFIFYSDGIVGVGSRTTSGGTKDYIYTISAPAITLGEWTVSSEFLVGGSYGTVVSTGKSIVYAGPDDPATASVKIVVTPPLVD